MLTWDWGLPKLAGLNHQAQDITFTEWISLITLCFAPLFAHVLAGTPQPIYLSKRRPNWYHHLCIYSPISIVWRYAAITDRRIRTYGWRPEDMTAANAIFWVDGRWGGSEDMANNSEKYITTTTSKSYADIISGEFLKTAIVTLQGVQAIYIFVGALIGVAKMPRFAIDTLFFAAAFLGLLRLFAACWLSDKYSPVVENDASDTSETAATSPEPRRAYEDRGAKDGEGWAGRLLLHPWGMTVARRPNHGDENTTHHARNRILPSSYWLSRVFRVIYITPVVMFWVITILFLVPGPWQGEKYRGGREFTLTVFLGALYIVFFFFAIIAVYVYYSWLGDTSTIVPCADQGWYRLLVIVSFAALVPLLVVSGMETRRTSCGTYTTADRGKDTYVCDNSTHSSMGGF